MSVAPSVARTDLPRQAMRKASKGSDAPRGERCGGVLCQGSVFTPSAERGGEFAQPVESLEADTR